MMNTLLGRCIKVKNLAATGVLGRKVQFDVDASRAGRGSLEVVINDGSVGCTMLPAGNGQYHVSFTPLEPKQHSIQTKFNGRNLPQKPFVIEILRGDRVTVNGPGLLRVPVKEVTSFRVRYENPREMIVSASITSPSGRKLQTCVHSDGRGIVVVKYMPTETGRYSIEVFCNGGAYSGNPLSCEVFDVAAITVRIVRHAPGETFAFEVDTSRAGVGVLDVTITTESHRNEDECIIPHTVMPLMSGLYLVKFTPLRLCPSYAIILFNSLELPQSPVRLDSSSATPGGLQERPTSPVFAEQQAFNPSVPTEPPRDDSILGHSSDIDDEVYVDMSGGSSRTDACSVLTVASSVCSDDVPSHTYTNVDSTNGVSDVMPRVKAAFETLRGCVNNDIQNIYVVEHCELVDDVLTFYKDKAVASKTLSVEFLGKPACDTENLIRKMFKMFWIAALNEYFLGEAYRVPSLHVDKMRKESWKFECFGRILIHCMALTGAIPSFLPNSTLIQLFSDNDVDDVFLIEDYLKLVKPHVMTILRKALSNFSRLTNEEYDGLLIFYHDHGIEGLPKQPKIKENVLNIAYRELVLVPGPLISKMRNGIPESHKAAFWGKLSPEDIARFREFQSCKS